MPSPRAIKEGDYGVFCKSDPVAITALPYSTMCAFKHSATKELEKESFPRTDLVAIKTRLDVKTCNFPYKAIEELE